jgi:AraC family transcriptional activator of pobA
LHIEDIQSRSRRYHWEIAAHSHQGLHQLVFVLQGPAEVQIDALRRALRAPALVVLPPAAVHAFRFTAETRGHVLTLAPEQLLQGDGSIAEAAFQALLDAPHILEFDGEAELPGRLAPLLERLHVEFRRPEALADPVCLWLTRSVLWIVARELAHRREAPLGASRQLRWLGQFRLLIEQHYAEHWPVSRYARALGLTEGRLNRMAQARWGRSAFEMVQSRVVQEARRRLTFVAMPVAQVAHELGFRDPAYFSRFMKRHAGLSPRAFRQQQGAS